MWSKFRLKVRCLLASLFAWILRLLPRPVQVNEASLLQDYLRIQELRRLEEERFREFYIRGCIR